MIAIETISDTLATMVARLTVVCPGVPRSWSNASAAGTERGFPVRARIAAHSRGIRSSVPNSISAIAR